MPRLHGTVTTTGSAGSASGSHEFDEWISGMVKRIAVAYNASCPSTTDVVVKHSLPNGIEEILATLTNNKTDKIVQPMIEDTDTLGVGIGTVSPYFVEGRITVEVAQCNAIVDAVDVVILVY